nr:sulfatase-like hydrolase/transferase [Bacteroidota bacterium]
MIWSIQKHYGENVNMYYDGISATTINPEISINDDKKVILDKLNRLADFDGTPAFFYLHFMSTHNVGIMDPAYMVYEPSKLSSFGRSTPLTNLINNFDNRVIQLDNSLKETISILDKKGYLENAIVIFTADLLSIPVPESWDGYSIFEENRPEFIFQHEKKYHSCIWANDTSLYQYVYNKHTHIQELFDMKSEITQYRNIIDQFDKERLQTVKTSLENFYSIKLD